MISYIYIQYYYLVFSIIIIIIIIIYIQYYIYIVDMIRNSQSSPFGRLLKVHRPPGAAPQKAGTFTPG